MSKTALTQHRLESARNWYSGQYSLAARNVQTGEEILIDPTRQYPTASTFKVPIMIEVFKQVEQGKIGLHDRLELTKSVIVEGSGVLRDMELGLKPTVHDVTMLMIIVSDNTATNMLIDLVGGPAVITATMQEMGYDTIVVNNRIDFELIKDDNRALAVASPRDYMLIMEKISKLEMISKDASEKMLNILGRQHYMGQGPRYVGYNPYGENSKLWVGNKTGSLKGLRADTGLFRLSNGTDIAWGVMNEDCAEEGFGSEYEADIMNGILGWIVLSHFWPVDELGPMGGGKSPYLTAALGDSC
ncbi:MAG: serine hydrolase [Thermomicrobiales bacterium]